MDELVRVSNIIFWQVMFEIKHRLESDDKEVKNELAGMVQNLMPEIREEFDGDDARKQKMIRDLANRISTLTSKGKLPDLEAMAKAKVKAEIIYMVFMPAYESQSADDT
jgi:hypothetical protein